jgi:lipopolysaccharide biosynthesis glycosyltransferase
MFNFLFAFDENYNIQGSVSIFSLLENVKTKINIYVIKDHTNSTYSFPKKILEHKNLNTLIVKEIQTVEEFYNISTSHVSQATFYRLYLSNLFENEDFNIVYLDADIVCVRNPIDELKLAFEQMSLDLKFIGFADELKKSQYSEPFKRLNMKNDKYFNAGVMLLNLKKWKELNYTQKSLELIEKLNDKAKFWDQDILNSLIDGEYFTISNNLNFRTSEVPTDRNLDQEKFIHYSGKSKPWSVGGIFEEHGMIYHKYYESLYNKEFHFVTNNRKNSIIKIIKYSRHFKKLPIYILFKYLLLSVIAIIKK